MGVRNGYVSAGRGPFIAGFRDVMSVAIRRDL